MVQYTLPSDKKTLTRTAVEKGQEAKQRLLHVIQASIFPDVALFTVLYCIYVVVICLLDRYGLVIPARNLPIVSALSLVISLMLVFRTNTAYERFMEGRRHWSSIQAAIRVFSRTCMVGLEGKLDLNLPDSIRIVRLRLDAMDNLRAFPFLLLKLLRYDNRNLMENALGRWRLMRKTFSMMKHAANDTQDTLDQAARFGPSFYDQSAALLLKVNANKPIDAILRLAQFIQVLRTAGLVDVGQLSLMENQLNLLTDAIAGCQRISKTPIPSAYSLHIDIILMLYFVSMPFSFVAEFGYWTVLICAIIFTVFVGVKEIGKEIENPFGRDYNDLPLELFCDAIVQDIQATMDLSPLQDYPIISTQYMSPGVHEAN